MTTPDASHMSSPATSGPATRRLRTGVLSFAVALALVGLPACGDDDTASDDTTTTAAAPTSAADESAELTITDVWARTSPANVENGAAYMTITGGSADDQLIGASASPDVAEMVQVHEVVPAEGSDTSMGDGDMGAMEMREVESVPIAAGATVELAPGGYHVMLMGLTKPLVAGDTFELTLQFAEAGEQTVTVEVRDA